MKIKEATFYFQTKINLYGKQIDKTDGVVIDFEQKQFRLPFIHKNKSTKDFNFILKHWSQIKRLEQLSEIKNQRLRFYFESIWLSINKTYKISSFNDNDNNKKSKKKKLQNYQLSLDKNIGHYKHLKIKIKNKKEDLQYVEEILQNDSNLFVRLDGNQQLQENLIPVLNNLYKKYPSQIDFIEEPFNNPKLNNQLIMPIAYDESLNFENITNQQKIIVLKPSIIGGVIKTQEIIKKYHNKRFILSSFYEPRELYCGYYELIEYLNNQEIHGLSTYKYW